MYLPKEKYIKNKKGIARNYMAPVNVLILELNVRERLYSAMPFKILQIFIGNLLTGALMLLVFPETFSQRENGSAVRSTSAARRRLPGSS